MLETKWRHGLPDEALLQDLANLRSGALGHSVAPVLLDPILEFLSRPSKGFRAKLKAISERISQAFG